MPNSTWRKSRRDENPRKACQRPRGGKYKSKREQYSCHLGGKPKPLRSNLLLGLMAELEISNRLLPALRYFIWVALPFIFFWVAVEKVFEGQSYRALASLGAAVLSFVAAVYWYRIIPARFRDEAKELQYLRTDQSFIWVPLPFTFSFIAVGRFFDGGSGKYQALGFLAMAVLTFVVGVYWDRIIPARVAEQSKPLVF
jgi:hypothetical protein